MGGGSIASTSVSGIVLCGGLSRRMGRDKAWLSWSGQALLSHVVESIRPLAKEVFVVARAGQELPAVSACRVTDRISGVGPLAGLEAGLAAMGTPYGIAVACDMPWLSLALLEAMIALAPGNDWVIPRVSGRAHPLHAVYAKRVQPVAAALLARGERRVQALIGHARGRVVGESFLRLYDPSGRSVRGVNRRGAYEEATQTRDSPGTVQRRCTRNSEEKR